MIPVFPLEHTVAKGQSRQTKLFYYFFRTYEIFLDFLKGGMRFGQIGETEDNQKG